MEAVPWGAVLWEAVLWEAVVAEVAAGVAMVTEDSRVVQTAPQDAAGAAGYVAGDQSAADVVAPATAAAAHAVAVPVAAGTWAVAGTQPVAEDAGALAACLA